MSQYTKTYTLPYKMGIGCWLFSVLMWLSLVFGSVLVVSHFVRKYW